MTRVLVVDDEPLIADSLLVYLQDEGMEVITAESGEEAVELARTSRGFNVCIMDMRLPGVDGNRAIRELASLCPSMKFVIHTGSVDYSLPEDLRSLGVSENYLFRKPLSDMASLANAVRELVE